jgi:site-specific DNA-methyltransferase (adenine-specific)
VIDGWVGDVTYVTVATRGPRRFFDLDAVRTEFSPNTHQAATPMTNGAAAKAAQGGMRRIGPQINTHAGAPPLDWHIDNLHAEPPTTKGATPMLEFRVGDVFDRLAEIPDGSIDLIVTSPPFLALRSYLPADHPDKHREIGSEATPAAFIDTLLALSAEFGRVLAPHGSICVELGDTYSGNQPDRAKYMTGEWSMGADGGGPDMWRLLKRSASGTGTMNQRSGEEWPLAKSLTGIPTLYPWSLAYGRNLLTGQESPAGRWRIRNVIVWARPNPPVGALGDKFRPATAYITVACRGAKRFFDLDAVRQPLADSPGNRYVRKVSDEDAARRPDGSQAISNDNRITKDYDPTASAGAPPLDWHTDQHPEDGDWLWKLPTQPYKGAHYATFPLELPTRLIMAMCPLKVCTVCGKPSERMVDSHTAYLDAEGSPPGGGRGPNIAGLGVVGHGNGTARIASTLGWSDCGHNQWRTGIVLDPFGGSGTVAQAAQNVGRHAILIDLDQRNADLAQDRVGMFLNVEGVAP